MTPYEKVNLQTFLLATIRDGGAQRGVTERNLAMLLRREGYAELTEPELKTELRGMADKLWLIAYVPAMGERLWRITTLGQSVLAEQNI